MRIRAYSVAVNTVYSTREIQQPLADLLHKLWCWPQIEMSAVRAALFRQLPFNFRPLLIIRQPIKFKKSCQKFP